MDIVVAAGNVVRGDITLPGDKSLSHRAVILGSIAKGITHIRGFLPSTDCFATVQAMRQLGVSIQTLEQDELVIKGVGLRGLKSPSKPIDCGNSGTSMRLLTGLLAAQPFDAVLVGDSSLSKRPMSRIISPLRAMGAIIESEHSNGECYPPLQITGQACLKGIDYSPPVASAQVKTAILFAGLYATGNTVVREKVTSRDHSERMMATFGCSITRGEKVELTPGQSLQACSLHLPGDFSSAAFFIGAACMQPGAKLTLKGVGVNPTRTGFLDILRHMGATIRVSAHTSEHEPVADIEIEGGPLQGVSLDSSLVVRAIDELPMLSVVAAVAKGKTIIRHARELRVKETDRIEAMALGLKALGVKVTVLEDGMIIDGGEITGGRVNSFGDHRVGMAFAMASVMSKKPIQVEGCEAIATSFPQFLATARGCGFSIEVCKEGCIYE